MAHAQTPGPFSVASLFPADHLAAPHRVLTHAEVSAHLGITVRTLRRLVSVGTFPPAVVFSYKTRGWYAFELALVVDARMRGANDEQVRGVVARIVKNREEAPILATPLPLSPSPLSRSA